MPRIASIGIGLVALVLAGCGEGSAGTELTAESGRMARAESGDEGPRSSRPAKPETAEDRVEEAPTATDAEAPSVTAGTIDSSEPIRVAVLREAILPWFGDPVVIEAYLFDADEGDNRLSTYQQLAARPGRTDDADALVECQNGFGGTVGAEEPLYVRGSLPVDGMSYGGYGLPRLEGCEVLAAGRPPADVEAIALEELAARTLGWIGREVTIEGYFKATRIDHRAEGSDQITVELTETSEAGFGDIAVECRMPAGKALPEGVEQGMADVALRGAISAEWGFRDRVHLVDCEFADSGQGGPL